MSEHRRKPPMPTSGGRAAARRAAHEPVPRTVQEIAAVLPTPEPEQPRSNRLPSRFLHSRVGRSVLAGSLLVGGSVFALQEEPPKAQTQPVAASSVPHTVYRTGGDGVWLHASPGLETPRISTMPDGAQFNVDCFVPGGDLVNGNAVWLEGDYNGIRGAVTDYYIDTHWNTTQDLVSQGIEQCGTNPALPEDQPKVESYDTLPDYNRQRAVDWALTHANDSPPFDGACTWFASNALWEGGLEETNEWHNWGGHGKPKVPGLPDSINGGGLRPGSVEATSVPEFLDYLKKRYPNSLWLELDFSPDAHGSQHAEAGDIIAYDWGHGEGISHVSVVVDKDQESQYTSVAEWGVDGTNSAGYDKRGWTYSEKHDKWLQEDNPDIKAYLLHIVPRSY
jgi:hypothetical protein